MQAPMSPSSASFAKTSRGNVWWRSQSAAYGSISWRANSRVRACTSFCSAERSKSTLGTILRADETAPARGSRAHRGGGGRARRVGGDDAEGRRARVEQGPERERQRRRREAVRVERTRDSAGRRCRAHIARACARVQRVVAVCWKDRADHGERRSRDCDVRPRRTSEASLRCAGREGGGNLHGAPRQDRPLGAGAGADGTERAYGLAWV